MPPTAIVLRQNLPGFSVVDEYYNMCKREPTRKGPLAVDRVDSFKNTFKSLVEMMLAKRRSHVVVVAHGTPELGLTMDIASGSHVSAGACMYDLVKLVDQLDDTGGQSVKSDFLSSTAKEWDVSEAKALSLAKTCWNIRGASGICVAVHIRGCDIGKQALVGDSHIRLLQRLFRSAVVSAPDCPMFYVRVKPGIVSQGVEKYAASHSPEGRRYIYKESGRSPLLLDIRYLGAKSEQHSAIEKLSHVNAWANHMHETTSTTASSSFVVAGLWPRDAEDYYLAHESQYIDHLVTAKSA